LAVRQFESSNAKKLESIFVNWIFFDFIFIFVQKQTEYITKRTKAIIGKKISVEFFAIFTIRIILH